MEKLVTLQDFYQKKFNGLPDNLQNDSGHFNVFRIEDHVGVGRVPVQYNRRDFYKISLIRGRCLYHYLNRSIRETTGKTTTDHIAERVVSEARALLKHTDWTISEISYSLGFDEPTHFNNFFKKKTQLTPSSFRQS